MAERDRFELDLATALRAYAEGAPTEVRPAELARHFAAACPHRRTATSRWTLGLTPAVAWTLLATGLLLALVVGGLVVGARRPDQAVVVAPSPTPATSPARTVTVTVTGLTGASGSDLAGILYGGVPAVAGGAPGNPPDGLGGFMVAIDTDPFSATETLRRFSPLMGTADQYNPVAAVPAGTHTLVLFVGKRLGPYDRWIPSAPIDRACKLSVTVADGQPTNVVVTVIPATEGGMIPASGMEGCQTD